MKEIPLTQGKVALVDDEDFEELNKYKWHAVKSPTGGKWYALRRNKERTPIHMHRFLLDAPTRLDVDHINNNGLDNQKGNLRICTRSQNHRNRRKIKNPSGYKGIWFEKRTNRWVAEITIIRGKKKIYLGSYLTPKEAANAYDEGAIKHFGEFAYTNAMRQEESIE